MDPTHTEQSGLGGGRVEFYGIYVLWLRDLKRYLRARSRILGSLGMPFFLLAFLGMGFRRAQIPSLPPSITYIEFLAPGIVCMVILFSATFSGISIVWDRQFGFMREIMVSPLSRTTIAIGRTLGGATTSLLQGSLMLLITFLLGVKTTNHGILLSFIFMILIAISFTGLGIAISTLMEDIHGFQIVVNFFVFPIFFLSGALFPINELPGFVKTLAYLNPLTYGVDGMRWSLIGFSNFSPIIDLAAVSTFTISTILISTLMLNRAEFH
jgi:ABC-2 type transport system permease protein